MKRIFLFSVLIAMVLGACQKEPSTPVPWPDSSIPYWKPGNTWDYQVTSSRLTQYKYVRIAERQQESSGIISYKSINSAPSYLEGHNNYHYLEDGFLKKYPDYAGHFLTQTYLKTDANVGDTWDDGFNAYKLESVNDTVKVPAGFFVCKKVREVTQPTISGPDSGKITYKYYSDQIGLVKSTGWQETYVLIDYHVQ